MRQSRVLFELLQMKFLPELHSYLCDYFVIIMTYLHEAQAGSLPYTFKS